ncbi:MAG: hypothetical protein H7Z39_04065, partial [Burkholderiaceae bacterium]|nr:hypothetical protein [Burkholderiaceae bacterium]
MPANTIRFSASRSWPCLLAAVLAGCGTTYTVDDGSAVDPKLLSDIRLYGKGQRAVRPAIVRSAQLRDPDCSNQWEIPFMAATSYDLPKPARIAWVRALQVDERLTVVAAAPGSGLAAGDKIVELDGYSSGNTLKMLARLEELRDDGDPFFVKLASFNKVEIKPVKVCRGHAQIAAPANPLARDYHWLQSTHPLAPFAVDLTPDEALWTVLWTQGLSEEGGAKMKTYQYGLSMLKTGINIASLVSGAKGVQVAAESAYKVAASQAAKSVGNMAAEAAAREAMKVAAQKVADSVRDSAILSLQKALKAQAQAVAFDTVKAAALYRGSLSGTSWVAGFSFDAADKWALERIGKLGGDPLAGFTLHYKLATAGLADSSLILDEARLKELTEVAALRGMGGKVALVLNGEDPDTPPAAVTSLVAEQEDTLVRQLETAAPPATRSWASS